MTSMNLNTALPRDDTALRLRSKVARVASRGQWLATAGALLLVVAGLLAALFVVAAIDAVTPMGVPTRVTLLLFVLALSAGFGLTRIVRCWGDKRVHLAAAQQIERAGQSQDQPVVRGLSMIEAAQGDLLADALRQRARQRADRVAAAVPASRAYPLANLRMPALASAFAIAIWAAFAIAFPAQFVGQIARAAMPWSDTPPFSLTQLDPTWDPEAPLVGQDVTVAVTPSGKQPGTVDLLLVNEQGNEIERFTMRADNEGAFHRILRRVDQPVRFKLEAFGRPTRTHTITPVPTPADATRDRSSEATDTSDTGDAQQPDGGSTSFDADAIAERDLRNHPDWPAMQERLDALLEKTKALQAETDAVDPSDLEALKQINSKVTELTALADALAKNLSTVQGDLPSQADARLEQITASLSDMQSAAVGRLPSNSGTPSESEGASGAPTPTQWAEQIKNALEADYQRIARATGFSDQPTTRGLASGTAGDDAPTIIDPAAAGTHTQQGTTGDTGPLPDAVMQQVPPSYRPLVNAYFSKLADQANSTTDNSITENNDTSD